MTGWELDPGGGGGKRPGGGGSLVGKCQGNRRDGGGGEPPRPHVDAPFIVTDYQHRHTDKV